MADPPQGQAKAPETFARETMISDLLKSAGYRCGYMGKWHMDADQRPGHGYDQTYTFEGGSSAYQNPVMYLNGERRQEQGYLADLITRQACAFLELTEAGGQGGDRYGVGVDGNIVTASIRAIISGVNRLQPGLAAEPAARAA